MPYGSLLADTVQSSTSGTAPTFKDGNGTETGTLCRAWVNFNGTGTVAIRASFNVSSITDNGTGDYTVNFTTALPDANFAAAGSAGGIAGANPRILGINTRTTTTVRVSAGQTALQDESEVSVAVFR